MKPTDTVHDEAVDSRPPGPLDHLSALAETLDPGGSFELLDDQGECVGLFFPAHKQVQEDYEAFTALWHAYELGRIARRDGTIRKDPFGNSAYYRYLAGAWLEGWTYEGNEQRTETMNHEVNDG